MKTDLSSLFMPRQSQMPKDEAVSIYDSLIIQAPVRLQQTTTNMISFFFFGGK